MILEAIVANIPPPGGDELAPARALVFDSHYDSYKGVVAYVRVVDGEFKKGEKLLLMSSGREVEAVEVGIFHPKLVSGRAQRRRSRVCGDRPENRP